ncbi:S8 family serine peptidase [Kribbella sp. CA-294648]|uniref:S8 family serine peptidase n=1 Tax=Kribbella sp. CA-294648 TaxID=3239948 RepID=UPI003D8A1864
MKFPAPALLAVLTGSVILLTAAPSKALGSEQATPAADPPVAGTSLTSPTSPTSPASVTLVTGDRVTIGPPDQTGRPSVRVEPRATGAGGFSVLRDAGRVSVIPKDVAALVPEVLDPALFDVTGLIEMRYDDAHRADLPVIVRDNSRSATVQSGRALASIGATAGVLPKGSAAGFGARLATRRTAIRKVWLDRPVTATALSSQSGITEDRYLEQVKASAARAKGLDGRGVKVAVLDTGVDAGHPALDGKVTSQSNFTQTATPADGNGHGTHVSSLIVGNGAGADGARQGIAPAAELISGKVLADDGFGQESWVIAGMEWAAGQGADLVNLSLSSAPVNGDDPVAVALEQLTAQTGTLFVAAAGNRGGFGANPYTIGSPGVAASALTVGAVDGNDKQAGFSSEGPTRGSYRLKPDLTAPGVSILGAKAGARDGDLYTAMSGTSQATPIVTGAAALLLQQQPDRTWQQLKTQLTNTADPTPIYNSWTHGAGRLDLQRATGTGLTAATASVDFAYLRYPDKSVRSRVVTLTNTSDTATTVSVTDQQQNDRFESAPAGAVVATPATLTIPAGGTASTTITVDPGVLPDGIWQGGIDFTSTDQQRLLRLGFGTYDESERYDLTVKVLDRTGTPYAGGQASVFNYDTGGSAALHLDANGTGSIRMDRGHYGIFSGVTTPADGDQPETFALAGTADVLVAADTTYVVDARNAKVLTAPTVEKVGTSVIESAIGISRHSATRGLSDFYFFTPEQIAAGTVFIQPTTSTSSGSFEASTRWRLEPIGKVGANDPAVYELLYPKDRFSLPLSPRLDRRALNRMARVENTFGTFAGSGTETVERAWSTGATGIGWVTRRPVAVPSKRVELLTADPAAEWNQCLTFSPASGTRLCDPAMSPFPSGARVERSFGSAIHPSVFAASHTPTYLFADGGVADAFHDGKLPTSAYRSRKLALYRDGVLVGETANGSSYFRIPNGSGRFRLEQSWSLDASKYPRSGEASTVWNFDSAPPPDPTKASGTVPSLLQIGYDPDVDGYGRATAWRPLPIKLTVSHLLRSTPSRITSTKLSYSVDGGRHWTPAVVVPVAGGPTAVIPPWSVLPGKSLSLRASATDATGGSIEQTVIGAIPVT